MVPHKMDAGNIPAAATATTHDNIPPTRMEHTTRDSIRGDRSQYVGQIHINVRQISPSQKTTRDNHRQRNKPYRTVTHSLYRPGRRQLNPICTQSCLIASHPAIEHTMQQPGQLQGHPTQPRLRQRPSVSHCPEYGCLCVIALVMLSHN